MDKTSSVEVLPTREVVTDWRPKLIRTEGNLNITQVYQQQREERVV